MPYVSTRGGHENPVSFSEAVISGLAPRGGLWVPEKAIKRLSGEEFQLLRNRNYAGRAYKLLSPFCDGIPDGILHKIVQAAYSPDIWESGVIAPLRKLDSQHFVLELFHGSTLAFKDFGMQFAGPLFQHVLGLSKRRMTIVVATSGDTGSAGIEAFRGKENVNIIVLFPTKGVSDVQRRQMTTIQDSNVFCIEVPGKFDNCQDIVKALFEDKPFRDRYQLGAINSINWARIIAQVVYYFDAYFQATERNSEEVTFVVPTGNFGNVYAAHIARLMGLPIKRIIAATNENDMVLDFFRYGQFAPRKEIVPTDGNSMDVGNPSNVERLTFEVVGSDPEKLWPLLHMLKDRGLYSLDRAAFSALHETRITAMSSTVRERQEVMQDLWRTHQYVIDPHTAAGFAATRKIPEAPGEKRIFLATASPVKFGPFIQETLGFMPELPERLKGIFDLPERVVSLPANLGVVKTWIQDNVPPAI